MKKRILTLLMICSTVYTYAQFPYSHSMTGTGTSGSMAPAGLKIFSGASAGLPQYLPTGTRLTTGQSQFSALYFSDVSISTSKGFVIDFTYSLSGGSQYEGRYGDGFALILFDGDQTNPTVGPNGSSLGYAYNRPNAVVNPGLSKGYLGIGFDSFGGYKNFFLNTTDYRNGITNLTQAQQETGDNITIRGPYNPNLLYLGANYSTGYPVLVSQNISGASPNRFTLDTNTGSYISSNVAVPAFGLRGSEDTSDVTNDAFRRVVVEMTPGIDASGNMGFYLNVTLYHGLTSVKVITDYYINTNSVIKYPEINITGGATTIQNLSLTPPANLKLGFSASTGLAAQVHEIREVNLTLPYSPSIQDISINNICASNGRGSQFSVLDGSVGYISNIYIPSNPPQGNFDHLDLTSFRFKIKNSNGGYTLTSNPYVLTTDAGTYNYDPSTGKIIFTPNEKLENSGINTESIYYDIKNKRSVSSATDLSTEEYRSRTGRAIINFTTTDCLEIPKKYLKINA